MWQTVSNQRKNYHHALRVHYACRAFILLDTHLDFKFYCGYLYYNRPKLYSLDHDQEYVTM